MGKSISRERLRKILNPKSFAPPLGHYNPKFFNKNKSVYIRPRNSVKDKKKEKKKNRAKSQRNLSKTCQRFRRTHFLFKEKEDSAQKELKVENLKIFNKTQLFLNNTQRDSGNFLLLIFLESPKDQNSTLSLLKLKS